MVVAKAERPNREMLVITVAVLCFTFRGLSNSAFAFVPSSVGRTSMEFTTQTTKNLSVWLSWLRSKYSAIRQAPNVKNIGQLWKYFDSTTNLIFKSRISYLEYLIFLLTASKRRMVDVPVGLRASLVNEYQTPLEQ